MDDDVMFGSGNDSINDTEDFNCRTSVLSTTNVTDRDFWTFRGNLGDATIAIAFFESLIFVIALSWNLFIFITYLLKYRLLKEPANIMLFTLSIVDLLICILIIPFPIIVVAASGEYIFGNSDVVRCIICQVQGYFFILSTELSLHLLAILSIDRCILLSNPLKYKDFKKVWTTVVGILVIWVLCFLLALPPAFGFGEWEFNRQFGVCIPRWTPFRNSLYMMLLMVEGLIPIIALGVTNVWTFKIVNKFLKKNLERKKSFRATKEEVAVEKSTHRNQQNQLVKVFGALFIANIIAWTPLLCMTFVIASTNGDGIPSWLLIVGWFMFLLNPTVHPILESFFIKELRTRVNRASNSVKQQVRRASRSILKMATLDSFKDIPTMNDEDESERSRRVFGLKRKSTSQSLGNASVSTSMTDASPPDSPMGITRVNTLTNSGRFPYRNRRSSSPKDNIIGTELMPPSPLLTPVSTALPRISEDSQLALTDIAKSQRNAKPKASSITDLSGKKKKRHISITVPGEKDVYRPEDRDSGTVSRSPSPSPSSSNDSAIVSGTENDNNNVHHETTANIANNNNDDDTTTTTTTANNKTSSPLQSNGVSSDNSPCNLISIKAAGEIAIDIDETISNSD